jgi:TonB family protein
VKRVVLPLILVLFAQGDVVVSDEPTVAQAPVLDADHAYHLRLVHVAGVGGDSGAAVGWAVDDGQPVLLPEHEAWGTPSQLDGIARALGAESAEAVTGFFVMGGEAGVSDFRRKVYVGESVLDLEFQVAPPAASDDAHQVSIVLESPTTGAPPLTEAEMLVRTDRTVAVACPEVANGDWLVVAVTRIDRRAVEDQSSSMGKIHDLKGSGVEDPRILKKVEPSYPETARKDGLSGFVVVDLVLDRQGVPHAPTVVRMSPGCEELAAAAVEAVLQWRFAPATLDGRPVPVSFQVTVSFMLT